MNNNDLIYDWLDFATLQKDRKKKYYLKEQTVQSPQLKIIPIKTNFKFYPRGTNKIEGIVIHHTAGPNNPKATIAVLEQRGYSTNFEIDQQGNIYQYLDPKQYAAIASNTANLNTIAIDLSTGDGSWPTAQKQSLAALIKKLSSDFGFSVKIAPDRGPMDWSKWRGQGYTIFRHRNFHTTACPSNIPLENILGTAITENFFRRNIIKENIIQVPNNLRKSPRKEIPQGIVIHHTVTSNAKTTLNVLTQRNFSTNYEVDQEGRIYEYIDPNEYYAIATGGGANNHTIAIDVTTGNESWPSQQVQSVKNLVDHLSKKYGFQLNLAPENLRMSWKEWKEFMSKKGVKYTLFRHKNFAATACPASFPMDKLISGTSDSLFDFSKKEDRNEMKSGLLGGKSDNNDVSPKDSIKKSDDTDSTSWASIFADDENFKNIDTTFIKDLVGSLSENIDRKIYKINDKTKEQIYSKYKKYFNSLLDHLKKELKITKPVKIVLEEDEENSKKVLGRTGGYINHEIKIHIFCSSRHIKDIMRSLSHEMVHHSQNIRGEFKNHEPTEHGYAQTNKHLRKMEEEAYLKGNILFRDWEDNYKYRNKK